MSSPKTKRIAGSLDDDDVVTPKKDKKSPVRTPKVVKLEAGHAGSPLMTKSPMISTPLVATTSAKKPTRKTPAKQKEAASTPGNGASPQAGKISQPSPVQTRSARRKKAETVGTPVSLAVTPSAAKNTRALTAKSTPKSQKTTPHAKGKINTPKGGAASKLKMKKLEDSDALDSDDDGSVDSDDVASDDDIHDSDRIERLKSELDSILNRPATRKSILKLPKDEPAELKTSSKKQSETPLKANSSISEMPIKANESTPARGSKLNGATPSHQTPKAITEKEKTPVITGKRPSPSQEKTPSKKARRSIKVEESNEENDAAVVGEAVSSVNPSGTTTPKATKQNQGAIKTPASHGKTESNTQEKTPSKGHVSQPPTSGSKTPIERNQTQGKTPVKKETIPVETLTPAKIIQTPGKKTQTPAKSPAPKSQTPGKTPGKEAKLASETSPKTPQNSVKTPSKQSEKEQLKTQADGVQTSTTGDLDTTTNAKHKVLTAEQLDARKQKKKANKLKKKEANKKLSEVKLEDQKQPNSAGNQKKKIDVVSKNVAKEVLASAKKLVAKGKGKNDDGSELSTTRAREERSIEVRAKLLAEGKSEEEIAAALPSLLARIEKRLQRTVCIGCRKTGHVLKDCTTFKAKPSGKCYKCGSTTHSMKTCSITEEVYPFANCFICNKMGHLTRSCPSKKTVVYPFGGACFNCGDANHLSKNCTSAKNQDENAKPSSGSVKTVVDIPDIEKSSRANVDTKTKKPLSNSSKQGTKKRGAKI